MSKESRARGAQKKEAIQSHLQQVINDGVRAGFSIDQIKEAVYRKVEQFKKDNPQESHLVTAVMMTMKNMHGKILDALVRHKRQEVGV